MSIEPTVMELLLAGDDPTLTVLRDQFHAANVTGRMLTGVGFFLDFSVPPDVPRLQGQTLAYHLGDVAAEIEGLKHGAGFVLHVRHGEIACLEGFSYGEPWPANVERFRASYIEGDERDHAALWKKWAGLQENPIFASKCQDVDKHA